MIGLRSCIFGKNTRGITLRPSQPVVSRVLTYRIVGGADLDGLGTDMSTMFPNCKYNLAFVIEKRQQVGN